MSFFYKEQFISGNEAAVQGAIAGGASFFSGYPITPATEILEISAKINAEFPNDFLMIQAEDETTAGFNVIGAILAGVRAFTATAGPGNILMQDPIAMAEAMRLPFVGIIMQRGGPSTGTVIYGQQEITLTAFGGNGEGLRIVYSTNSPQELYDYTKKSFEMAWRYRFPTFVLGDGYQSKEKAKVKMKNEKQKIKNENFKIGNIRNCYGFEDELNQVSTKNISDFKLVAPKIIEYEKYLCNDAESVIFCHGIISLAAKEAVDKLRKRGKKVGLFRPITINPFPALAASSVVSKAKKIYVVESSGGAFLRLVKANINCDENKIVELLRPVLGITSEEIMEKVK